METGAAGTDGQYEKLDTLHFKVENELIKLIESLQKKLTAGDWEEEWRTCTSLLHAFCISTHSSSIPPFGDRQHSTIPFLLFPWSVMPACSATGGKKPL
jgi:hypothetical protein